VIKVAVFASGNGSNAINLYNYFHNHPTICIDAIYCNNPNAGIINKSKSLGIKCIIFEKKDWISGDICQTLINNQTDFIVLAGFLWLVPKDIIQQFNNKIINIHPALLPNYGGKGMYGMNVHEKVIADKQNESGITIHLVNEEYDKGEILLQERVKILESDTADALAAKIHLLEYAYFPKTVEKYILKLYH
jgi:phosphoribosylglycinamide formyltransferase-1